MLESKITQFIQQTTEISKIIKETAPFLKTEKDFERLTLFLMRGIYFGNPEEYIKIIPKEFSKSINQAYLLLFPNNPEVILNFFKDNLPSKEERSDFLRFHSLGSRVFEITEKHWELYRFFQKDIYLDWINIDICHFKKQGQIGTEDRWGKNYDSPVEISKIIDFMRSLKVKTKEQSENNQLSTLSLFLCKNKNIIDKLKNKNNAYILKNLSWSSQIPSGFKIFCIGGKDAWLKKYPMLEYLNQDDFFSKNLCDALYLGEKLNLQETRLTDFCKQLRLKPSDLLEFSKTIKIKSLLDLSFIPKITSENFNSDLYKKCIKEIIKKPKMLELEICESLFIEKESFKKALKNNQWYSFISNSLTFNKKTTDNLEILADYNDFVLLKNSRIYINDIASMIDFLNKEDIEEMFTQFSIKDFFSLHCFLSKKHTEKKNKPFGLNLEENFRFLNDLKNYFLPKTGLKITIPQSNTDLISWGNILHNCVGGSTYSYKCKTKQTIIIGLKDNDFLSFCIEIEPRSLEITQFEGKYRQKDYVARAELQEILFDLKKSGKYPLESF